MGVSFPPTIVEATSGHPQQWWGGRLGGRPTVVDSIMVGGQLIVPAPEQVGATTGPVVEIFKIARVYFSKITELCLISERSFFSCILNLINCFFSERN